MSIPSTSEAAPDGQSNALWMSALALAAFFALWTAFAITGVHLDGEPGLSGPQSGLFVDVPTLTGSLSRIVLGVRLDQNGSGHIYTLAIQSAAVATTTRACAAPHAPFRVAALGGGIAEMLVVFRLTIREEPATVLWRVRISVPHVA